ncbi:MAG: zinc ribbon domain-containing protein [Firmicutes bacterium]|nr:zinc ribbon domain-containing protein [Bacillota bacterium]
MPLYEFQCQSCDHKFEELCRSSDTVKVKCPRCGEKNAKRLVSTFGFSSAGSGVSSASSSCGGCAGGSCSTCH